MTARELYFKLNYMVDGLPYAVMNYMMEDKDGVIQIGNSLFVSFRDDMEKTLQKIEETEKISGFMFWDISPEGEQWYKDNWNVIGKLWANMVINQR